MQTYFSLHLGPGILMPQKASQKAGNDEATGKIHSYWKKKANNTVIRDGLLPLALAVRTHLVDSGLCSWVFSGTGTSCLGFWVLEKAFLVGTFTVLATQLCEPRFIIWTWSLFSDSSQFCMLAVILALTAFSCDQIIRWKPFLHTSMESMVPV